MDTGGVIHDWRLHLQLQHTLICKECYKGTICDGGMQTDEGWWIFDTEYIRSLHGQQPEVPCLPTISERYQLQHVKLRRVCQNRCKPWLVGMAHEDAEDQLLENVELSEPAGVSVENHINEQLSLIA